MKNERSNNIFLSDGRLPIGKILVACEESQAVTIELRKLGYEAYSCDSMECSGGHPEWHIQQDVTELLKQKLGNDNSFFLLAHFLSKAGACRLYPTAGNIDPIRYQKGVEAKEFFYAVFFLNADCERIAVEKPSISKSFLICHNGHKKLSHTNMDTLLVKKQDYG